MRKLLFTALVCVLVGVALPAQQAPRRFTLDDFSKVARVSDPQFAPDGKSIAVVVARPNLDEDRYDPELTVVDVATKSSRTIVKGLTGLNFERWSPDGTKFAFLANVGGAGAQKLQLFVVSAKGGAAKALTSAPRGVQQFAWSPDSKTLAFATQDDPEKKPGFEKWNRSFEVTLNTDYTMTEAVPPTHLWTVSATAGEPKRLTSGTWTMPISHPPGTPASAIVWTPDGTGIVITRNGGGRANPPAPVPTPGGAPSQPAPGQRGGGAGGFGGGLQVVHINDGSMTPLGGNGTHPQFSPDGKMIATNNGSVFTVGGNGAVAAPVAGGNAAGGGANAVGGRAGNAAGGRGANAGRGGNAGPTSSIDRGIARALWMPDGKSLVVGANDSERVSLWQAPLEGGNPRKIDTQDVSPNSSFFVDMSLSKDGAIAFTGTTPLRPAELYYMATPTSAPQRLTTVNDELTTIPLAKSEVVTWKNDNFDENGVVTYPPGFNPSQKYPLVLYIHGGPAAASLMTWSSQVQLYAAQGWVVFQPNYRGSDNLGRQYQGAIRNDAGEGPGRDVVAGIEMLKQKGFVDDSRMCVSGWSYGGYMTTWMTGHYPDMWKCAVTGASVTNRLDQHNFSDSAGGGGGAYTSQQSMDREMAQSPISAVSKVKAPTLILHDTGDYRVAITESFEWFHALKENGVTTQFIAYPVYGHSPTDPVHQRDVQRRWVEWMQTYIGPNASPSKGGGR